VGFRPALVMPGERCFSALAGSQQQCDWLFVEAFLNAAQ